jgi:hypothetical protein
VTWEEGVWERTEEKLLSPDMNRKEDRVWTAEAARKGEVWNSLKISIFYEEILIDIRNFQTPIGVLHTAY